MIVKSLITWTIILNVVTAPPPLRVELAAEKETLEELQTFPGNIPDLVIDKDDKDSNINIFEDDDFADDTIDDSDAEQVDDFEPIYLPKEFVNYDLNGDRSIDINELATVTGAMENIELAFNASDTDGDGKISESEFYSGPLNFDINIDMVNETDISDSVEIHDSVDTDENLIGTNNWGSSEDKNKIGIGIFGIKDNMLYADDKKLSTENLRNTDTLILRKDYIDSVASGLISNEHEWNDADRIGNDEENDNDDDDNDDDDEVEEYVEDEYGDDSYDDDDDDDEEEETDDDDIDEKSYDDEAENVGLDSEDDNDDEDSDEDDLDDDNSNEDGLDNDVVNDDSYEVKYDDDLGLDEEDDGENDIDKDDLDKDVVLGDNVHIVSSTVNDKLNTIGNIGNGDVITDDYKTDGVNVHDDKTQ